MRVHASRERAAAVSRRRRSAQVPGADPRIYEEVSDMSQLQPTIEEYLNDYNAESKQPMPRGTVWKSISAPRSSERPKLGHDLRAMHTTQYGE